MSKCTSLRGVSVGGAEEGRVSLGPGLSLPLVNVGGSDAGVSGGAGDGNVGGVHTGGGLSGGVSVVWRMFMFWATAAVTEIMALSLITKQRAFFSKTVSGFSGPCFLRTPSSSLLAGSRTFT